MFSNGVFVVHLSLLVNNRILFSTKPYEEPIGGNDWNERQPRVSFAPSRRGPEISALSSVAEGAHQANSEPEDSYGQKRQSDVPRRE